MKIKKLIFILILGLTITACKLSKNGKEITIFIGPETKPRTLGVMEAQCLQVKWTKDQKEWENFSGIIDGFTYEPGYEYELIIKAEEVENPPADVSSLKWKLIKQVSKTTKAIVTNEHTSKNSLDWHGTYEGTLPCANCEGIKTTITLNLDNSFTKTETYLKNGKETKFETEGKITWDLDGNTVILKSNNDSWKYKVGENKLIHLDKNGKVINGQLAEKYILKKIK